MQSNDRQSLHKYEAAVLLRDVQRDDNEPAGPLPQAYGAAKLLATQPSEFSLLSADLPSEASLRLCSPLKNMLKNQVTVQMCQKL